MTEFDIVQIVSQVGFPITTSVFLLWKGYTQDKEYLSILTELKTEISELRKEHLQVIHP